MGGFGVRVGVGVGSARVGQDGVWQDRSMVGVGWGGGRVG